MKKFITLFTISLLFISCGEDIEKKAGEKIRLATEALTREEFSEAKLQIDSIKILYPKAFEARRQGIKLMQQVELKEQQHSLVYLDSMLQAKQADFDLIKGRFILEKNAEYQETGNYFWPTQTVEKNLHRSFLRFQVNEKGAMSMTSIYCGGHNINHIAVKVSEPGGTFAETPASDDSYYSTDGGEKIEKADYPIGKDGSVMGFLYLNKDKNIKVEYLGERKFATTMSATDRKALAELYELSQVLGAIEEIGKEQKEAHLKIEFVTKRISEGQKEE